MNIEIIFYSTPDVSRSVKRKLEYYNPDTIIQESNDE